MKRRAIIFGVLFLTVALTGQVAWGGHEEVVLKGYDGKELSSDSQQPYSPKQTCGECHEYDQITNGYHFQQGRTNGAGEITMSDGFNKKKPWTKSDGMFGKW